MLQRVGIELVSDTSIIYTLHNICKTYSSSQYWCSILQSLFLLLKWVICTYY